MDYTYRNLKYDWMPDDVVDMRIDYATEAALTRQYKALLTRMAENPPMTSGGDHDSSDRWESSRDSSGYGNYTQIVEPTSSTNDHSAK
ncbi:hypothetical protein DPMN_165701 [Dreissena polymorpha]|uniref:Uncharacterized protein n=1 Tax=Dreissena polymorpha TaxID=45954 RepID=A0A9D4F0S1_DREPO|nr:hypothetical protein DPMN_165701 [Dreissena polymorpha]